MHEGITVAIIDQTWVTYDRVGQDALVAGSGLATDAILALPEMQAIRKVLAIGGIDWMVGQNLPKSVIDWVMEGEK